MSLFPEIFLVQVPNIASVHARLITLHREPHTALEVASTVFTVSLYGEVYNEVEIRKCYRVSFVTKSELKNIDESHINTKPPHEEVNIYQDGNFSHNAELLSSIDVADIADTIKLKYTIYLMKSFDN